MTVGGVARGCVSGGVDSISLVVASATGDWGKGTLTGETVLSETVRFSDEAVLGTGEDLEDATGVLASDASPTTKDARSLSSSLLFVGLSVSGDDAGFGVGIMGG